MKTKLFQVLFLIIGITSAAFAAYLSFEKESYAECPPTGPTPLGQSSNSKGGGCGGGIDIAADGGAAGFAILSGLCFVSIAITTLRKDS